MRRLHQHFREKGFQKGGKRRIVADFQKERELEDENFVYENERNNFLDKNGESLPYEPLEISVAALQFKYKKLKVKWTSITCDVRRGSGLKLTADEGC